MQPLLGSNISGYQTILQIRRLEQEVDALGLRMGNSKHGNFRQEFGDVVALFPKDDALPIYSRDAEIFVGTIQDLTWWLRGFQKSREYDRLLLGKSVETKRERREQDYRNKQLMQEIKEAGQEEMEMTDA
jgi:hypothetical protein